MGESKGTMDEEEAHRSAQLLLASLAGGWFVGVAMVVPWGIQSVESDLVVRVEQAVARDLHPGSAPSPPGLEVTVDRRDVRLAGVVPHITVVDHLRARVAALPGVRSVDVDAVEVVPPASGIGGAPGQRAVDILAEVNAILAEGVAFDPGEAHLGPASRARLDEVVAILQGVPGLGGLVVGHPGEGVDLGSERAAAVVGYLEAAGIRPGRFVASMVPMPVREAGHVAFTVEGGN